MNEGDFPACRHITALSEVPAAGSPLAVTCGPSVGGRYLYIQAPGSSRHVVASEVYVTLSFSSHDFAVSGCYRPSTYPRTAAGWDYAAAPNLGVGTTAGSWADIRQVCRDKGMDLCTSEHLCAGGVPANAALEQPTHDNWIAVGDRDDTWFTFNALTAGRLCKSHYQLNGGGGPAWGTSSCTSGQDCGFYRYGLCCGGGGCCAENINKWGFSTACSA